MKTHVILPLLFVFFICQNSCSQVEMPAYPKYQDVVKQFFTRYTTKNNQEELHCVFAKKPDGWHAMMIEYESNKVVKDQLFWSRKTKEYKEIDFPYYVQAEVDRNQEVLLNNSWAITSTELVPYWGYNGWEMDVIKEFSGKNNLSDSLLNAVARAYASYARSFTGYSEFGDQDVSKKMPKGQNSLSPGLLAKYLENEHKSIEFYYRLYKQNPKFETFVSDIYNVYSNEIMNAFLTLRYYQNEETAQKELKKGIYDPFYVEMAKNYLNSCDQDAILFTNGDMDTYPLLYVQEAENFRKDVLVVNLSFLNLGRYIYHLANFGAGAKALKLGMDAEIYKSESKPLLYIQDNLKMPVSMKEIIDFVSSKEKGTKLELSDKKFYDYIPTRDIYFKINKETIKKGYSKDLALMDSSFNIHLSNNYITIADFCVLDIMAANNFERPIYFASTVADDYYALFNNYIANEAFGLKVTPVKSINDDKSLFGKIDSKILQEKLFNKLKFDKNNYKDLGISQKRIVGVYRHMFSMLASQFIRENDQANSMMVMDRCLDLFPSKVAELDYYSIEFIENYFKIGKDAKAKTMLVEYANSIYSKLESMQKENSSGKQIQLYLLNELYRISSNYLPQDKISNEIQEKIKQIQSVE
jgi:hypothetical protein